MPFKRSQSFNTIQSKYLVNEELFKDATNLEFNLFDFSSNVGREKALPFLALYLIRQLPEWPETLQNILENRLVAFLNAVQQGYKSNVTYHNDLHAADVT